MRRILVMLLGGAALACGGKPGGATGISTLLITLDTTRADALGCYSERAAGLTDNLDRLAARGVVYEYAHTVAPLTLPAHASILTGLYPPRHGIRNNGAAALPPSARTLAEAAREGGYQTAAFVGAIVLDRAFGLEQGFETYSGPVPHATHDRHDIAERPSSAVIDEALAWLRAREPSRPFFLWVHLFDPHAPYAPPAELRSLAPEGDPYLGEVASMDREIGRLLGFLEAEQLLPSTAILCVADHGEARGEHGEPSHGFFCYEPTLRVPLVLARPGGERAGERSGAVVSVADVAPTLAEAMGVALADDLDGRSFYSSEPPSDRGVYCESYMGYLELGTSPLVGWLDAREKYLESSSPEIYDLRSDPLEQASRLEDAAVESCRSALAQVLQRPPLAPGEAAAIHETLLEGIRALGYAAATGAPLPDPLEPSESPSPRERVGELVELTRASNLYDAGDPEEALAICRRVGAGTPLMAKALSLEAACLIALRRPVDAIEPLERYLALAPGRAVDHFNLGACLKAAGRTEEALASFARALELEPAEPYWFPAFLGYLRGAGRVEQAAELEARYRERAPAAQ